MNTETYTYPKNRSASARTCEYACMRTLFCGAVCGHARLCIYVKIHATSVRACAYCSVDLICILHLQIRAACCVCIACRDGVGACMTCSVWIRQRAGSVNNIHVCLRIRIRPNKKIAEARIRESGKPNKYLQMKFHMLRVSKNGRSYIHVCAFNIMYIINTTCLHSSIWRYMYICTHADIYICIYIYILTVHIYIMI